MNWIVFGIVADVLVTVFLVGQAYRFGFDAGCRDERAYWLPALRKAYDETLSVARRASQLAGDPPKGEATDV